MEDKFVDFTLKIPLGDGAEILVEKGQEVGRGESLAKIGQGKVVKVELVSTLEVKPTEVLTFLQVAPGRQVSRGQVLAQRKKFLKTKKVLSPISGKITSFDQDQGVLEIVSKESIVAVNSPLKAKVTGVGKDFLTLGFGALILPAKASFGRSGWGQLKTCSSRLLDLKDVDGKIALVGDLDLAFLNKLEALGTVGVVCSRMSEGLEKEVDDIGLLLVGEADFKKACQQGNKRAKIDVGDKRLIIAK